MEGSQHQTWLMDCDDPRQSRGSPERGRDQNIEGTDTDPTRKEITKRAAQFKR